MIDNPHSTLLNFGWPHTQIAEYEEWSVLVRPRQVTLGAMVLVAKSDQTAFSKLESSAHTELSQVTQDIETAARAVFSYDKINYLMLMMVDPHVHFHVLPRYNAVRKFRDIDFVDPGWPGLPDLSSGQTEPELIKAVRTALTKVWTDRSSN